MAEDPMQILLRRMADGDESALAELFDEWGERVHSIAFCILRDADEAEDVVDETFWQAWRTASRYDRRRGTGATWLIMIARSRALDRLRTSRRRAEWTAAPAAAAALLDNAPSGGAEPPAAQLNRTERNFALNSALSTLPPEQREVVELAFFGGLSHVEIAAQTSQPLGTVKTRIRLAMQKLREHLSFLREEGS